MLVRARVSCTGYRANTSSLSLGTEVWRVAAAMVNEESRTKEKKSFSCGIVQRSQPETVIRSMLQSTALSLEGG